MKRIVLAAAAVALLAGCADQQGTGDQQGRGWSLRAAIADAVAPPGHTVNGAPQDGSTPGSPADVQFIGQAYQADIARQQAGLPSMNVSQVTIFGGRVKVPTGGGFSMNSDWRDADGSVATVTVAECQVVPVQLQRADKMGAGAPLYVTRVGGIIYVSPFSTAGCGVPAQAMSYPSAGQFPLSIRDRVDGARIRIEAWGTPTSGMPVAVPVPVYGPRQ
jgi:hypothetical protein